MMEASLKVPDGKLLKLSIDDENDEEEVELRGDFFLEPPEALEDIQDAIADVRNHDREEMVQRFSDIDADFIGFDEEDLADLVIDAEGESE